MSLRSGNVCETFPPTQKRFQRLVRRAWRGNRRREKMRLMLRCTFSFKSITRPAARDNTAFKNPFIRVHAQTDASAPKLPTASTDIEQFHDWVGAQINRILTLDDSFHNATLRKPANKAIPEAIIHLFPCSAARTVWARHSFQL